MEIIAQLIAREDTLANWTGKVPLRAELCYCTTAGSQCLFTGDGTTAAETLIAAALAVGTAYTLPDATASVKGGVKLAGMLGGTAASPTVIDASTSSKGAIKLAGVLSGTADAPTLASNGVGAGTYNGANVTVGTDGRVTAIEQGPAGFAIVAAPYAGFLASPLIHVLYACTINTFYIESHEIASIAGVTPGSGGVTLTVYKNGSLVYTKTFTVASTTDATANVTFAAGDSCQFLLSAVNGTKMVTLTARGVRA